MPKHDSVIICVAVAVVAIVVFGEAFAYFGKTDCTFDADSDGNWSLTADKGDYVYSVTLMERGKYPSEVVIYYDENYGKVVNPALVEVGARALDTEYYISQLKNNLNYFGVENVATVNAEELRTLLSDSAFSSGGIICISGALPDTVYDGTSDSPILKWISEGGTLYWAEQQIGRYIGHADGSVTCAESGFQTLFLKSECLTDLEQDESRRAGTAYGTVQNDGFREALCLKNNNILYSVQISKLETEYLAIGFEEEGCASIVFVGNGSGQICVIGGDYSNHQRMDLATIIASKIGIGTNITDITTGSVNKYSEGSFDIEPDGEYTVFALVGGDFAIYGKCIELDVKQ